MTQIMSNSAHLRTFDVRPGMPAVVQLRMLDNGWSASVSAGAENYSSIGRLAFALLWLLVFAIPWEDAVTIPGFGTGTRLIGIPALILGVIAVIERGRVRHPGAGHVIMILFALWATVSYLWSVDPEETLVAASSYRQLLAMVWLIWELAPGLREQMLLLNAYVLGTFVSGIDTAYEFLSHHEAAYQRYTGGGSNPNDLALLMALSIPASYYLLIQSKGWMVWVYRLQLILAGTTILLSAARGGFLAGLVAFSIVPLIYQRSSGRRRIAALLTTALVICGGLAFLPASSWERLSTIPDELREGTLTGRTLIWGAGLDVFREHPFLGVGAAGFRESVNRALSEEIVAHNTFLSILVEEGVIGFSLFCTLLGVLALSVSAMPSLPRRFWIVILAVWVVGVSSLTWEIRKPTWFFFGLLMAQWASLESRNSYGPALVPARPPFPQTRRA
jgi:O-antigen ligase